MQVRKGHEWCIALCVTSSIPLHLPASEMPQAKEQAYSLGVKVG